MKCNNCTNKNDSELKCSKNQIFGITKPEFFHCDYFDIKHDNYDDWWNNLSSLDKLYFAKKYNIKIIKCIDLNKKNIDIIKMIFDSEFLN